MGNLKYQYVILMLEFATMDAPEGPIPWRWPRFQETLKFPPACYPKNGISRLPMDCPDLKGVADTQEKYMALQGFFDAFRDAGSDEKAIRNLCTDAQVNEKVFGLRLFREYWKKISDRAKFTITFDRLLARYEVMPWQAAALVGLGWPPEATLHVRDFVQMKGNALCQEIFGPESNVTPSTSHHLAPRILLPMLTLAWDRAMKREPTMNRKLSEANEAAEEAWAEFKRMPHSTPNATKIKTLKHLFKLVSKQIELLRVYGDLISLEKAEKKEEEVKTLLDQMKGKGSGKLSGKIEALLQSLMSPAAIEEMERIYEKAFRPEETMEEILENDAEDQAWLDEAGDIGVAEFRTLSRSEVFKLLGLPDGDFPFFNRVIHDLGTWPEDIPDFENLNKLSYDDDNLKKNSLRMLKPRWHQLVGLAASVNRFFQGENVMIADGVGVGKTMECFMIMAYLRHLIVTNSPPPPIARMKVGPEDADREGSDNRRRRWGWGNPDTTYPSGHILVVVPHALAGQWESEAKRMLDGRFWNIIRYPSSEAERREFWSEVWTKQVRVGLTTILIVTHIALRAEARLSVPDVPTRTMDPEQGPTISKADEQDTIFSQRWSLSFWDEAQWLRSEGHLLRAAHAIRVRCGSMILCSATPLHNGERDLVSLGLALGIQGRTELLEVEGELRRDLGRVLREYKALSPEEREEGNRLIVHGKLEPLMPGTREYEKQEIKIDAVHRMRALFMSCLIRRRNTSVDNEGNKINGLPPLKKKYIDIEMGLEEKERFQAIAEQTATKMKGITDTSSLPTKTFFAEYRIAVGHSGFYAHVKPALWRTREEWVSQRSAKWTTLTKLLLGLLNAPDEGPFPTVDVRGNLTFPKICLQGGHEAENEDPEIALRPQLENWDLAYQEAMRNRYRIESWPLSDRGTTKIILYVEYVKTLEHLIRGLELSGIKCIAATGKRVSCNGHTWRRDEAIEAFKDPAMNYRVLLLSSVGNAGLNLHVARFMIFGDMVWSGQSEEQIIGRMYRQPNEQNCIVYYPRVTGTTDDMLARVSRNKEQLLEIFYGAEASDGEPEASAEYTDAPKTVTTKKPVARKAKGKAKKTEEKTTGGAAKGEKGKSGLDSEKKRAEEMQSSGAEGTKHIEESTMESADPIVLPKSPKSNKRSTRSVESTLGKKKPSRDVVNIDSDSNSDGRAGSQVAESIASNSGSPDVVLSDGLAESVDALTMENVRQVPPPNTTRSVAGDDHQEVEESSSGGNRSIMDIVQQATQESTTSDNHQAPFRKIWVDHSTSGEIYDFDFNGDGYAHTDEEGGSQLPPNKVARLSKETSRTKHSTADSDDDSDDDGKSTGNRRRGGLSLPSRKGKKGMVLEPTARPGRPTVGRPTVPVPVRVRSGPGKRIRKPKGGK